MSRSEVAGTWSREKTGLVGGCIWMSVSRSVGVLNSGIKTGQTFANHALCRLLCAATSATSTTTEWTVSCGRRTAQRSRVTSAVCEHLQHRHCAVLTSIACNACSSMPCSVPLQLRQTGPRAPWIVNYVVSRSRSL